MPRCTKCGKVHEKTSCPRCGNPVNQVRGRKSPSERRYLITNRARERRGST